MVKAGEADSYRGVISTCGPLLLLIVAAVMAGMYCLLEYLVFFLGWEGMG